MGEVEGKGYVLLPIPTTEFAGFSQNIANIASMKMLKWQDVFNNGEKSSGRQQAKFSEETLKCLPSLMGLIERASEAGTIRDGAIVRHEVGGLLNPVVMKT